MSEKKSDCLRRPDIEYYCKSCGHRMYFDAAKRKWEHDFSKAMADVTTQGDCKPTEAPNPTGWKKDWGK